MNRFFLRFPGFQRKALTLSYDDGVQEDARLVGMLNQAGILATFNLNSGLFGQGGQHPRLTGEEALALYGNTRHEVAVHSYTHPFLEQLPAGMAAQEIIRDREQLETLFSRIVRGMAYPMGTYNDEVVGTLGGCGIAYARTTGDTRRFDLPGEFLRWHPTCRHADPLLPQLCADFLAQEPKWNSRLFYLWGHSYEFAEQDNWDVMERFCQQMGGRGDIWYATNGEICDYLQAGRQLQTSADGSRICNMTAIPLYFETEDTQIRLDPGSCVTLQSRKF